VGLVLGGGLGGAPVGVVGLVGLWGGVCVCCWVCVTGFGVEVSLGFLPAVFSTVRLRIRAATFDPAPAWCVHGHGGGSPSDGRTTRAGRRQLWLAGV
jgi:hypothetical protein